MKHINTFLSDTYQSLVETSCLEAIDLTSDLKLKNTTNRNKPSAKNARFQIPEDGESDIYSYSEKTRNTEEESAYVPQGISWGGREQRDKGYALKYFFSNNILLSKNKNDESSFTSINGLQELECKSPTNRLPYGPALKIILWICDQAFKRKSLDISQDNLKIPLNIIGMFYGDANRTVFKNVLETLQETEFCFKDHKSNKVEIFKIVDTFSYKTDPKYGNRLVLKITPEFLLLLNNKKNVRAFDYQVIRDLGCDYTTLHFYLFSIQRSFKLGRDAHIKISEFLKECGSKFSDCNAFLRKIKQVVIPKLEAILRAIYGQEFTEIFHTEVNKVTKVGRIILKMGRFLLPKKILTTKIFLLKCLKLFNRHGPLTRYKLTHDELDRLKSETGKSFENLVRMETKKLQSFLTI